MDRDSLILTRFDDRGEAGRIAWVNVDAYRTDEPRRLMTAFVNRRQALKSD